ncbi:penicillin acylase family protein [Nocardioides halotolerans]|jgi:acyl-homoserine lactone acylase PvdQ|uniref:penicillin acylase family protein n=1 Tax=Nocardioides halotolerans TaxID=433660 RepID=UPI00040E0E75|nr:penicillin acylase family protein [Nocardioides halotolerans]
MRTTLSGLVLVITTGALLATTAGAPPSSASGQPPAPVPAKAGDPYGNLWNILPPGSNGNVTTVDLASLLGTTATPTKPAHFADQLEMYDALTTHDPGSISQADIEQLYKREDLTPATVVSTKAPRPGVTIQRDAFGVPFINGATYDDVEFGAGYAAVEDRMFLMDVLRHTGAGRMAEFVGNTPGNVAMDQSQIRAAYYTPAEANAQIERAARDARARGQKLLNGVDAFLAGINQAQHDLCPILAAPTCPAEYALLQKIPTDWTRADIVYVASLVGGIFGKGGGHEVQNAEWWQALKARFGKKRALQIYGDLREKNDPEAPTTSSRRAPYDGTAFDPDLPGVALPDRNGPTAPGTGHALRGGAPAPGEVQPRLDLPGGVSIDLSELGAHGMSNALLVTGKESRTGKPLAVMGPQTGYYAPQLLVEQVLNGPGIQARGVAFAGTNLFVQLGRGLDYAWSATSAGSDNIDTVVERLCNPKGGKATVSSTRYLVGKKCVPMQSDVHTETTTPNLQAPAPATTYKFQVLRTRHGIVQERTTVGGKPVALVIQRSTYGHEVDSVLGFGEFNDPGFVHSAKSFQRAASDIDYTFNWFYADSKDISYYSSGLLPKRSAKVEPDLPHWAGKAYDWKGWLSFRKHARETNPKRGYLVSWNNKPAPDFSAADDTWSYGSVYRSMALEKRLLPKIKGRKKIDLPGMVGVMAGGATADSRAAYTLPWLLKVIGKDKKTKAARTLLQQWLKAGTPRADRDRDGAYEYQAAIALFDTWWEDGPRSVAYDAMSGRLGPLTRQLPQILDDHPRAGQGSSFNGVAWYGYLSKDLRSVLGKHVDGAYSTGYCGKGSLKACRATLRTSLAAAVARILQKQGKSSVGELTYAKSEDFIRSSTGGVVGVRPIDWQNRPTFQQVISFLSHR